MPTIRAAVLAAVLAAGATGTALAYGPAPAGAAAGVPGTVVSAGGWLNTRSGPGSGYARTGRLANQARVAIACRTTGQRVTGDLRGSDQWDRLTNGQYVSHAYLRVTAAIGACAPTPGGLPAVATPAPAGVAGTVRSDSGWLNTRSGPGPDYPLTGRLPAGSAVRIACQSAGAWVDGDLRGTDRWDRLSGGQYVSHAYIDAGAAVPARPGAAAPGPAVAGPTPGLTGTAFIAAAAGPARQGYREFRVPASVTIAQAILESGWGRSTLAAVDRNFFGIKCFPGNVGPFATGCHNYLTTECTPDCHPAIDAFRVYATSGDSFRDHGYFLASNSRYAPAFGYSGNADAFIDQIARAGYATSPSYVANVQALMRQYDLYQYDLAP